MPPGVGLPRVGIDRSPPRRRARAATIEGEPLDVGAGTRASLAALASAMASSGWIPSWAYFVREARSRSAADSHSRRDRSVADRRRGRIASWFSVSVTRADERSECLDDPVGSLGNGRTRDTPGWRCRGSGRRSGTGGGGERRGGRVAASASDRSTCRASCPNRFNPAPRAARGGGVPGQVVVDDRPEIVSCRLTPFRLSNRLPPARGDPVMSASSAMRSSRSDGGSSPVHGGDRSRRPQRRLQVGGHVARRRI